MLKSLGKISELLQGLLQKYLDNGPLQALGHHLTYLHTETMQNNSLSQVLGHDFTCLWGFR